MKQTTQPMLWLVGTLLLFSMVLTSCTKNTARTTPANIQLTEAIRTRLAAAADSVFKKGQTPGMIAILSAEGEEDLILKRGVANMATGESMSENSYWRIASNTKTFVGAAVLLLVEEGKINLDSSISFYLPEYKIPKGNRIKVRMLGNMTSGLYNYTDDDYFWIRMNADHFVKTYPPDSMLAIAFSRPNNFEPGTQYEYCNTNTILLGLLMEKVTGKTARAVIEEKLLQPLQLTHTYWGGPDFISKPYIHGYNKDYTVLQDATNWNPSWGYTAGILISNFADMKIWARAVAEGSLLSEKMKKERFGWIGNYYGFGVMKAGPWIGHSGNIPGYNSHVLYDTGRKMTLIILTNMDTDTPVESFSEAFRTILN
ncbi:MAG: beta-lactamase family protein [Bacteroidetes bacterium]|nr:beta-lactamase family protein [Bacteroidota bacterium]